MAKQTVVDMLRKPIAKKQEEAPVKEDRSALTEKALALIVKQAKEEMQPLIDLAVANEKAAVVDRDAIKEQKDAVERELSAAMDRIHELSEAIKDGQAEIKKHMEMMMAETNRMDIAANEKTELKATIAGLNATIKGLETQNRSLQSTVDFMKTETAKPKPIPSVVVPAFDIKISERDINGNIVSVSAKPI